MDAATAGPVAAHGTGGSSPGGRGGLPAWPILTLIAAASIAAILALMLPRLAGPPDPVIAASGPGGEVEQAYSLVRDPSSEVALRIPLDGSFGDYIDLPTTGRVPDFPTGGAMEWVMPLGEYYGWDLWIAGARGALQGEHCVLIERGDMARSRCVPAALRDGSALLVSVPFDLIAVDERPRGMVDGERIGFWWGEDTEVTVLRGPEYER